MIILYTKLIIIEYIEIINNFNISLNFYNNKLCLISVFEFLQDKVILWWPNGYGAQKLYELNATFTSEKEEVTSKTTNFGFRTVELVQDKIGTFE